MTSIIRNFSLQLLSFFLPVLSVQAQLTPQVAAEIKEIQIASRKADPIGIFSKFSILGFIPLSNLDELDDSNSGAITDKNQQLDHEATQKESDKQLKYRLASIPILLEIGTRIAADAVTKYPEIVLSESEGGPKLSDGKSGKIMFFVKEGLVNGNRLMLAQIRVSGSLNIENQSDFQFYTVYFLQTPIADFGGVQEACEKLLKQFYYNYTSARAARASN